MTLNLCNNAHCFKNDQPPIRIQTRKVETNRGITADAFVSLSDYILSEIELSGKTRPPQKAWSFYHRYRIPIYGNVMYMLSLLTKVFQKTYFLDTEILAIEEIILEFSNPISFPRAAKAVHLGRNEIIEMLK